jgi:exopolyphosphatase/pppGpp-phosphohydrolase
VQTNFSQSLSRVAVVEIGSGTVRLLIVERTLEGELRRLPTSPPYRLPASSFGLSEPMKMERMRLATEAAQVFISEAKELRLSSLRLIATGWIRDMEWPLKSALLASLPGLEILTAAQEAYFSSLAALQAIFDGIPQSIVIWDQGRGSAELAAISSYESKLTLTASESLPLGLDRLQARFRDVQSDVCLFRRWLLDEMKTLNYEQFPKALPLIAQGSAITKFAFLLQRSDKRERYSAESIQGKRISLRRMQTLIERAESVAWPRFSSEYMMNDDIVGTFLGIALLHQVMRLTGHQSVITSTFGTRFGVAWGELANLE